jgi:hypothetical protein
MRTIIAGGRGITDYGALLAAVEGARLFEGIVVTEVLSGGAEGVDKMGERYAAESGLPPARRFPARWRDRDGTYNQGAGKQRNLEMAKLADALIAVWDGNSDGTEHMIETARRRKLLVHIHLVPL